MSFLLSVSAYFEYPRYCFYQNRRYVLNIDVYTLKCGIINSVFKQILSWPVRCECRRTVDAKFSRIKKNSKPRNFLKPRPWRSPRISITRFCSFVIIITKLPRRLYQGTPRDAEQGANGNGDGASQRKSPITMKFNCNGIYNCVSAPVANFIIRL